MVLNVLNELFDFRMLGIDVAALVVTGQESGLPILGFGDGIAPRAHGNESRQVLVFRAEAIGHPRTYAGPGKSGVAAVHQEQRSPVDRHVGVHGANDAHVVHALGRVGKQVADWNAALAVLLEGESRCQGGSGRCAGSQAIDREFFTVVSGEGWLGVEGVHVRHAAVQKYVYDPLGFCGEVGLEGCHGSGRCVGGFPRGEGQPKGPKAHARSLKKIAAIQNEVVNGSFMTHCSLQIPWASQEATRFQALRRQTNPATSGRPRLRGIMSKTSEAELR